MVGVVYFCEIWGVSCGGGVLVGNWWVWVVVGVGLVSGVWEFVWPECVFVVMAGLCGCLLKVV